MLGTERCVDGVGCYDCTSRCDVQLCNKPGCPRVHIICPVCKSEDMHFDATAPATSKKVVLRIASTSLAKHAQALSDMSADLSESKGKLLELMGAIAGCLSANPGAKAVLQQHVPCRVT